MANRNYRTARGVTVDIDALRLINDRVIAVGNTGTNARGDQVDKDGNIIKTRNEVMKENYKINARLVKDTPKKAAPQPTAAASGKATFLNASSPTPEPTQPSLRGALASSVVAQKPQTIAPTVTKESVSEVPTSSESESFSELLTTEITTKTLKRI